MNVLFTTAIASPYQVELFDALAASGKINISVLYWLRNDVNRKWDTPQLTHEHAFLCELNPVAAQAYLDHRDFVVFSGYHPAALRRLIASRESNGKPWAFWGERPGFLVPNWLGRLYRRLVFPELGSSNAPIWGIGSWAVDGYRREVRLHRQVLNVPYFSKLGPFSGINRSEALVRPRRILFSGSLIKRKGVDILLKAFLAIAPEFPELELHLLGDGPMREQLRALSAPAGDRVVFHGFKQWAELPAYYASADVLCAPSRYDGWGLIIPEALAAGLLVVSTNQTGAAIDLVDRETGWVVQAGELAPLIEALRAALSTCGRERLSRIAKGRATVEGQDVAAGVERVIAAINESLAYTSSQQHSFSPLMSVTQSRTQSR
jgi:glycosyltransferase involved in cell wall biosynthesis